MLTPTTVMIESNLSLLVKYNNASAHEVFLSHCVGDYGVSVSRDFLSMFYLIHPEGSTFEKWDDVPFYELDLFPMAFLFIVLEQIIRIYQGRNLIRYADIVTNLGAGIFFLFARVLTLSSVIHVYLFLYAHYRIIDLPLHHIGTWIISLLLVEFVYYWTHRALHEFNFFWGAHAFHHMDEDVNITTSVRDSVIDLVLYDFTPIPLAVIVPPQLLIVHMQFSLIYQIWLHNSVIGNLGFLEYIVNTPAQHRVHHGKNPYCIDTNYGALIMIYDRIFGTYRRERKNDPIVFGVVSPVPRTYNWLTLQWGYYRDLIDKFNRMDTLSDKLSAIFKGPGWAPGKPRLGLISDVPEPDRSAPKFTYNPKISLWQHFYVSAHFSIVAVALYFIGHHSLIVFSYSKALLVGIYLIFSFTSFGLIYDKSFNAPLVELSRLMFYVIIDYYLVLNTEWNLLAGENFVYNAIILYVRIVYAASFLFWVLRLFRSCSSTTAVKQKDDKDFVLKTKESNGHVTLTSGDSEKQIMALNGELGIDSTGDEPTEYFAFKPSIVFVFMLLLVGMFLLFFFKLFKVESCRASLNLAFESQL